MQILILKRCRRQPGLLLVVLLLIVVFTAPALAQPNGLKAEADASKERFRPTFRYDSVSYKLFREWGGYRLVNTSAGISYTIDSSLLVLPLSAEEDMDDLMDFDSTVAVFGIGGRFLVAQLSSYTISRGSLALAQGTDVFLTLDTVQRRVLPQPLHFGVSKQRYRSLGYMEASCHHFLLSPFREEPYLCLGAFQERIYVERSDDDVTVNGPFYEQTPTRWFVFDGEHWNYRAVYEKRLPLGVELPLIGLVMTPVEYARATYRQLSSWR